jgi:hypothetical protein
VAYYYTVLGWGDPLAKIGSSSSMTWKAAVALSNFLQLFDVLGEFLSI